MSEAMLCVTDDWCFVQLDSKNAFVFESESVGLVSDLYEKAFSYKLVRER